METTEDEALVARVAAKFKAYQGVREANLVNDAALLAHPRTLKEEWALQREQKALRESAVVAANLLANEMPDLLNYVERLETAVAAARTMADEKRWLLWQEHGQVRIPDGNDVGVVVEAVHAFDAQRGVGNSVFCPRCRQMYVNMSDAESYCPHCSWKVG